MNEIKQLRLEEITIDERIQCREFNVDSGAVQDYRDLYLAGVELPPLDVFFDGKLYYLADGHNRWWGARGAMSLTVPCKIRQGDFNAARMFAAAANQQHGLRRSSADKRKAIKTVLELQPDWSDRRIAEHVGVGHPLVADVRIELEGIPVEQTVARIGRDGKKRKKPLKRRQMPAVNEPAAWLPEVQHRELVEDIVDESVAVPAPVPAPRTQTPFKYGQIVGNFAAIKMTLEKLTRAADDLNRERTGGMFHREFLDGIERCHIALTAWRKGVQ